MNAKQKKIIDWYKQEGKKSLREVKFDVINHNGKKDSDVGITAVSENGDAYIASFILGPRGGVKQPYFYQYSLMEACLYDGAEARSMIQNADIYLFDTAVW
tara:strand:+ start:2124 stop:2426 length:303 start_codon:yes stop_codon:yes gene_type:complete